MHALICAAAGLTVSLAAGGVAEAQTAPTRPDATLGAVGEFDGTEGISARNLGDFDGVRAVPAGETFSLAVTAFSSAGGAFMEDVPDTGIFGAGAVFGGAHAVTGADTFIRGFQIGNVVRVSTFTANSSDWVPAGMTLGGAIVEDLFLEMGFNNAGNNPIFYPGYSPADVDSVTFQGFSNGNLLFSFIVPPGNLSLANGLAGIGGVSFAAGIGGFDIDEMQLVFTLNVPTPGAASVFGLAGLAAIRRRRR